MLKKYFILVVFLLFSTTLFAAEESAYRFGVKGGLSSFSYSDTNGLEAETMGLSTIGLNIGGIFTYLLNDNINIITEVMYENISLEYSGFDWNELIRKDFIFTFSYVTIPIGFHHRIINENFFLGGGLYYSVNLRAKLKIEGEGRSDIKDAARNDMGLFIDFGWKPKANRNFSLSMRYKHGIDNILEDYANMKIRQLGFNVAYHF